MKRRGFLGWLGAAVLGVLVAPIKALAKDDWYWSPRAFCPKCPRMMRERWAVRCDKCGVPTLVNTRRDGGPMRTADYIRRHPKLAETLKQERLRRYRALMDEQANAAREWGDEIPSSAFVYPRMTDPPGATGPWGVLAFHRRLTWEELRLIYEVEKELY